MKQLTPRSLCKSTLPLFAFFLALSSVSPVAADIMLTDTQLGPEVLPPGVYGPPVPNRDQFHYTVTSPEVALSVKLKMWQPDYTPTGGTDNTHGAAEASLYSQTGGGDADVMQNGHNWVYVGGIYSNYFNMTNVTTGTSCWYCGHLIGILPGSPNVDYFSATLFYNTPF